MRVPALSAWDVEHARSIGQAEQLDETRSFLAVALGREKKTVLQQVVGVEGRLPPLFRFLQKKTGSR
jgi:hypothetical protein